MAFGNPATRKFMKVPISDLREHCGRSEFGVVGFGYDPVDDDHKFLRMIHYYGRDGHLLNSQVKVYSLKSNTWKRVGDFPFKGVHRGIGVLVGSSLHWMMGIQLPDFSTSCLALAFDLVTEKYRRIPFPDKKIAQDKNFFTTMTELGGWLCELTKYRAGDTDWVDHVDIWVMKQYGVKESWVKLFSVVPSDMTGVFNDAMPLAYLKNTHQVLVDLDGGKIMLFDLEMNKAKSARKISDCPQCFNTSISVGSLVGFGGRDGDNDRKMAEENGDKEEKQEQSGEKR
ncbi:Kelch-type beta propeller [Trema orientale]|uniref:Kelch-type beta propeller n=1 Tax=Trema orientale TaxID=63057 RepID=A0A2P5CCK1_TREOI|nr:Kelch-type beta propeller [Trema orientale]